MMTQWRAVIQWLDRHNKTRMGLWSAIVVSVVMTLMLFNTHVSREFHFKVAQPFLLLGVAAFAKVVWYSITSNGPKNTVPWWQFWRWAELPVIAVILFNVPIALYGISVWLQLSHNMHVPDEVLNGARGLMWIASAGVIVIMADLMWRRFHPGERS